MHLATLKMFVQDKSVHGYSFCQSSRGSRGMFPREKLNVQDSRSYFIHSDWNTYLGILVDLFHSIDAIIKYQQKNTTKHNCDLLCASLFDTYNRITILW